MLEILKNLTTQLGHIGALIFGAVMILLGCYTFYWLRRRNFHRRNGLGVECFTSYASMIWTRNWEFIARLTAFAFLLLGGTMVVMSIIYAA